MISIDGTTGEVFAGAVPVADSVVVRHFEGEKLDDDLAHAVARIMAHADGARRLRVRTNADTPEDAARARRFGAQGIGLCRTEHMFLGERRELVEKLIVAEDEAGTEAALAALLPLQRQDFTEILEAMDGLPVTIRLLDPPLHEFLPDLTELSVKVARRRGARRGRRARRHRCSPTCAGSTSRTRCSACAASASASRSPGCSGCRPARSPRPLPTAPTRTARRAPRSWCRWSRACGSWRSSGPCSRRRSPRCRSRAGSRSTSRSAP